MIKMSHSRVHIVRIWGYADLTSHKSQASYRLLLRHKSEQSYTLSIDKTKEPVFTCSFRCILRKLLWIFAMPLYQLKKPCYQYNIGYSAGG